MGAVLYRLRADVRRRWVSWLGLALAIGLAGGIVLTAAAGARRTATAFDRFLDHSRADDVLVSAGPPEDEDSQGLVAEIAALPQVASHAEIAAMTLVPKDGSVPAFYHFAGVDRRYGTVIDRPNVIAGRPPRPDRADEVLVNRTMARERKLHVGSTVQWVRVGRDGSASGSGFDLSKAPTVRLRVVGIGVYPNEVVPVAPYDSKPFFYLSPAFFDAHPEASQEYSFAVFRLHHGRSDLDGFRKGLATTLERHGAGLEDVLFADRFDRNAAVRRAIQPQAVALGAFAVLAGATSLLVLGQVVVRQIGRDAQEGPMLDALGMTRRQLFATSMIRVTAVSAGGAVVAVVGSVLASPLMPIGPARLAEPHRGVAANLAILGLGFLATLLVLPAVAALPAWRSAAALDPTMRPASRRRRGRAADALGILRSPGLPLTSLIGMRAALQPGQGRNGVPIRTALVGCGLAIATVAASLTFTTNLYRLVGTPRLYGATWDLSAGIGFFTYDTDAVMQKLRAHPEVEAVAGGTYGEIEIDGHGVPAVGLDRLKGNLFPTLLEGRPPVGDEEIVLGTRTLRRIHRTVGDRITIRVAGTRASKRIVGRAVFPKLGAGSFSPTNLGEGAAVAAATFDDEEPGIYTFVLLRLRPGTDVEAAQRSLNAELAGLDLCGGEPQCVKVNDPPGDISNFSSVRSTPLALAAVLALMAIGTLGHALLISVRRRRRDLAVLKTLGFTRRQVLVTVVWEATSMAAVALLIGLPVGVGIGRAAWRLFAEQLGVAPEATTPVVVLVIAVPATILLANLIAAAPAMVAARTNPAVVLRSE